MDCFRSDPFWDEDDSGDTADDPIRAELPSTALVGHGAAGSPAGSSDPHTDSSDPPTGSSAPPNEYAPVQTSTVAGNDASSMSTLWYGADCPDLPDLSGATTLDICREECQEWAKACGFKLVQKGADMAKGKATFVCGCKGRKARNAGNCSLDPAQRRARSTQYALPGEDKCPFQ